MRESRVLNRLRDGKLVSCVKINYGDPQVSELAAMAGFDCIWIDQEHQGQDWSVVASHIWAAKAHNADIMVRISRGSYCDYIKPLEMDATGILVPHIMGLQDAKNVIHMTRFHPIGRRALDGGNADGGYTLHDPNAYMQHANKNRFIILQIEDPEPLDELEEIAALDGFEMLFFGPGDFSHGIGAPAQWDHPRLIEARQRVADVAKKYGKFAGTVGSPANMNELIDLGYQFVSLGADVVGVKKYFQDIMHSFQKSPKVSSRNSYYE